MRGEFNDRNPLRRLTTALRNEAELMRGRRANIAAEYLDAAADVLNESSAERIMRELIDG